jgi:uncharacterized membrane protein HdeD (DUF308 family)
MTADTEHHRRAVAWSGIGRRWAWGLAFGVITIVALALLLGIVWIASGVIEVLTALSYAGTSGRAWRVLLGIISVIAGIILLAIPAVSLLVLVFLISAWLLLFGVMEISLALRLRSAAQPAHAWYARPRGAT